jgi:hypothetical protein
MAPYVAPMGAPPGGANNGMAIAALVLGIVSLVLFFACGAGALAGVLAIVFGFIGIGKAKEIGKGRGMSLAGLILGLVGIIGGILVLVLVIIGINNASDNVQDAFGQADSSNYDLTTDTCKIDQYGSVTFDGTIENTASRDLGFNVVGEVRDNRTGVLLTTENDYVQTTEGDTVHWSLDTYIDNPTDITCNVTEVNNWFN